MKLHSIDIKDNRTSAKSGKPYVVATLELEHDGIMYENTNGLTLYVKGGKASKSSTGKPSGKGKVKPTGREALLAKLAALFEDDD